MTLQLRYLYFMQVSHCERTYSLHGSGHYPSGSQEEDTQSYHRVTV